VQNRPSSLDLWLSELRAGDEARIRRRQHWLRQAEAEQATFVGTVCDLAEASTESVLETTSGRRHTGVVRAVGIDFCAISEHRGWTFVALRSLAAIRSTAHRSIVATGDRSGSLDLTMVEALSDQLEDRPTIVVWLESGERVQGQLIAVGQDVISVRVDGEPPHVTHVNGSAVSEVGL
jgi:hypothetical protein